MRIKLVHAAKKRGLKLRQTYVRIGKRACIKQARYAHAAQMKRAKKEFKKVKSYFIGRDVELENIFVLKEYRKIRNDHTFSYGNKFFLIESPLRSSIAKQKIEIRTDHTGDFQAYFAGKKLSISQVIEPTKLSMADLEIKKN